MSGNVRESEGASAPRRDPGPASSDERESAIDAARMPTATGRIAAPSILSADFARLGEELAIVDPARDWVHCDVMDNHFVPNLTFGPLMIEAVRKLTRAFVDVHLMIEEPVSIVPRFRAAGADQITVHLEACADPAATIAAVRATGARAGLAIKPGTPLKAAEPLLAAIDLLLVMTVEPGFGGQAFIEDMLDKVRAARTWREANRARYRIEVDGGIDPTTAKRCAAAGAEVFVAGHAVFGAEDASQALARLRAAIA
jgi:ribulose-phosphate 3-epimerase